MPRYQIEFPQNSSPHLDRLRPDAMITRFSYHAKNTDEAWAIFKTIETFFTPLNYAYLEIQGPVRSEHNYIDFHYTKVSIEPTIESRCPYCGFIDFLVMRMAGKVWHCTGCDEHYTVCDNCVTCSYRVACLERSNYER